MVQNELELLYRYKAVFLFGISLLPPSFLFFSSPTLPAIDMPPCQCPSLWLLSVPSVLLSVLGPRGSFSPSHS